ncbi:MAG: 30S ribosomal protein S15 [Nitrospinota bacterium]
MPLTKEIKGDIIAEYQSNSSDTGSTSVQIAILTRRIKDLMGHFSQHKKDHHSRHGLLSLVSKRRKLLKYLMATDYDKYKAILKSLELRR